MTTASKPSTVPGPGSGTDPLQLIDVDHVRFYVGNARQSAYFYAHCFGFDVVQYADLTTGSRREASYLLTQGNIRMLLTTGLHKDHPVRRRRQGPGLHRCRRGRRVRGGDRQRRRVGLRAGRAARRVR
jgi:catechol 2,3-dioxygenase-like lactoylglutathione lyase family enzyme